MGPVVFRVMPDGRPVPGDSQGPLPKDEDVEELRYPHIPSIEEIETKTKSRFSPKPEQHSTNALVSPFHERRSRPTYRRITLRNLRNIFPLYDANFSRIPHDMRY